MSARLVAVAVLVAAALPVAPSGADAPVEGPAGLPCRYLTAVKSTGDQRAGYLVGGPYAGSGTLTCSLPYGTSRSESGMGVVALRPTPVALSTGGWQPNVRVCTSFTPDGGPTLYWHDRLAGATGHWGLAPGPCGVVAGVDADQPTWEELGDFFTVCCMDPGWTDYFTCEAHFLLHGRLESVVVDPEDGDLWVGGEPFWDCAPYGDMR